VLHPVGDAGVTPPRASVSLARRPGAPTKLKAPPPFISRKVSYFGVFLSYLTLGVGGPAGETEARGGGHGEVGGPQPARAVPQFPPPAINAASCGAVASASSFGCQPGGWGGCGDHVGAL